MRLPRMTTRRWMITVVVTAILVRAAHGAERYRRIRAATLRLCAVTRLRCSGTLREGSIW